MKKQFTISVSALLDVEPPESEDKAERRAALEAQVADATAAVQKAGGSLLRGLDKAGLEIAAATLTTETVVKPGSHEASGAKTAPLGVSEPELTPPPQQESQKPPGE